METRISLWSKLQFWRQSFELKLLNVNLSQVFAYIF